MKKGIHYKNKPNSKNALHGVVVEIPKTNVITRETILKTFYRDIYSLIIPGIVTVALLCLPIFCCVYFYTSFRWYYAFLPILMFITGMLIGYSVIDSFIKTIKKRDQILNGNLIVEKSQICDVCSEYDNPVESDYYYIKIDNDTINWISVSEPIYYAAQRGKTCYIIFLSDNGKNVLLLIYIGQCTFDKSIM